MPVASKADPIFRGSKRLGPFAGSPPVQVFQSRPDLQGVKTEDARMRVPRVLPSKADPIFRGSKLNSGRAALRLFDFQSRPDLQGVKTRAKPLRQQRNRHFQSRPDLQGVKTRAICAAMRRSAVIFQSRPDLQGVKTRSVRNQISYRSLLPKQTRSSGGQNAAARKSDSSWPLPKQTRSSGGQNASQ